MNYHDEEILLSISCRINSYDKSIPDCMCALVLTPKHIYALEDNYDGTYTEHIVLETKSIIGVAINKPFADSLGKYHTFRRGYASFDGIPYGDSELGKAIVGSLDRSKKQEQEEELRRRPGNNGNKNKKFFMIDYNDSEGNREQVYFDDFSKFDARRFVSKFNRLKKSMQQ